MVSRYEVIGKNIALVHASHRGDDMLASLRLVLATVSENFQEDIFLRVPLIGKLPKEIDTFIQETDYEKEVMTFISRFMDSVSGFDQ